MITRRELYTIDTVDGYDVEVLGYVKGSVVQTKHLGKDIASKFKSLVGGEVRGYSDMMNEARQIATERLLKDADDLGANAILGFRLQTSGLMGNAAEIIAYGTAVKLTKKAKQDGK